MDNSGYTVATVRTGNHVSFNAGNTEVLNTVERMASNGYFGDSMFFHVDHTGHRGDQTSIGAAGNSVQVTQATVGVFEAITAKEKSLAGMLEHATEVVEAKDKELAQVKSELARVNQLCGDLHREVNGNRATIAEQKELLKQKDAIIAEQKKLLEKKDSEIREPDPRAFKVPRLDRFAAAPSPPSATAALRLPPIAAAASTPPPDVGSDASSIQAIMNRAKAVFGAPPNP